MKTTKLTLIATLMLMLGFSGAYAAQVGGSVTDSEGQGMSGVAITVKGGTAKAVTTANGSYTIDAPDNATLVFSHAGYDNINVPVNNRTMIDVSFDATTMEDLVVIGYGSVRKEDLTGSVSSVSEKDFLKGGASPDRLLVGKVAGLQVSPNGGAPGSGSRIRIRGGASLNASNDPLIIIDGLPLENGGVAGAPSMLSTINPDDIESMTVLKDASATAIYGSRASNGVIMITTKQAKKGQKLQVGFSTQNQISTPAKKIDVLTADQVREIVNTSPYSSDAYRNALGTANTKWQDKIYQNAFGTDNNLSVAGAYKNLPYRVSLGYLNEKGILRTGQMERFSGSLNLNPRFLDNHLKVDVSLKGSHIDNRFAPNTYEQNTIQSAVAFDPTQHIKVPGAGRFNDYFTWLDGSGQVNSQALTNPMLILDTYNNTSKVKRVIASAQVDYRMHFMPELRANVNVAYDYAEGRGNEAYPEWVPYGISRQGKNTDYGDNKTNKLFEAYLNYNKYFTSIKSNVDLTAGYTYQDWLQHTINYTDYNALGLIYKEPEFPFDDPRNTLISFFGRLNYTFNDRYLITGSVRRDGSSRFAKDHRWGTFPSAAFAWRINKEGFMKNVTAVSDLKLRLGYGVTGQQDLGSNRYLYQVRYKQGASTNQYQFGDSFYPMLRPEGYNDQIRWESTTTWNAALDFGFMDNRLTGSVDFYLKKTKDLIYMADVPAGANFTNSLMMNVGNLQNKGVEVTLNGLIVRSRDWNWDASFNISYNKNKITSLTVVDNPYFQGINAGWIFGSTSGTVQMQKAGYPTHTFFLYKQVYNDNGEPLEGVYADINNDGKINDSDKVMSKSANPHTLMGFSTTLTYRKWSLGTVLRASLGNYVYNNMNSGLAHYSNMFSPSGTIMNVPKSVQKTNFYYGQPYSDLYLENASFLKMDNLSLSYDFGRLFNNTIRLVATGAVQNVFTVTKYSGIDPEISDGIDRQFYPRPRIFMLRLNFSF